LHLLTHGSLGAKMASSILCQAAQTGVSTTAIRSGLLPQVWMHHCLRRSLLASCLQQLHCNCYEGGTLASRSQRVSSWLPGRHTIVREG
jgi:hypothetical protein